MIRLESYYPDGNIPLQVSALCDKLGLQPSLEDIWAFNDAVWTEMGCTHRNLALVAAYYAHPIWTYNGMFTEQDADSMANRRAFAAYIKALGAQRVADYGGGFGTLARLLAEEMPGARVEIIEPFPQELAVQLSSKVKNLSMNSQLSGSYDVIVAADVLEHVNDPLALVEHLSEHVLGQKGLLILANCFFPVVKCHVPSTFHFRHSFDACVTSMGLELVGHVRYACVYRRTRAVRRSWETAWRVWASKWSFFLSEQVLTRVRQARIRLGRLLGR